MSLRTWRFVTLMLAALGMTMGAAHVLELGPRMQYDAETYARVTSSLYRYYGLVGAPLQLAAIVTATLLAFRVRRRPGFRLTLVGSACLVTSLVLWFALVQPVNTEWGRVIRGAPERVPEAYAQGRARWEYGHVAAFLFWLGGVSALVLSVVVETPDDRR